MCIKCIKNVAALLNQPLEGEGPSSDMNAFRELFAKAKHILVLTGAGISAESGVPTFRGAGGFWREYQVLAGASFSHLNSFLRACARNEVFVFPGYKTLDDNRTTVV